MAKYKKTEAKEAAKEMLKGVWTALPTCFTADDKLDDKANAWNLDYCIDKLQLDGHYFNGNVGEFWAQTNKERMRLAEVNVEAAKGRIPLIGGCHHQNPYEAVELCNHARAVGVDFAIILTPYMGARDDDACSSSTASSPSAPTSASCCSTSRRSTIRSMIASPSG